MKEFNRFSLSFVILLFWGLPGLWFARAQSGVPIVTPEQIKEDIGMAPCKDKDRMAAVKALFEKVGAPASDVSVDQYEDVANVVVRKKGLSEEKIIIGAHYDKEPEGCGAVDNWSGIVALARLYKTLKDLPLKKTILFVAFGKEEKGLVGSRAMAAAMKKEEVGQYCVMINLDSFGMGPPQVADNMSSKEVGDLAEKLAKDMKMPFGRAVIPNANSDSSSFLSKKIPAVTLHGLSNDYKSVIHTGNDQVTKVNPASVYLGYRLALSMVTHLDGRPCRDNPEPANK